MRTEDRFFLPPYICMCLYHSTHLKQIPKCSRDWWVFPSGSRQDEHTLAYRVASEKNPSGNGKQNLPQVLQNQDTVWYLLETRGGFLFNLDQCIKAQVSAASPGVLPSMGLPRQFWSGWSFSVGWVGRKWLLTWSFNTCGTRGALWTPPSLSLSVLEDT